MVGEGKQRKKALSIDIKINAYLSKSYIIIKIHARNTLAMSGVFSLNMLSLLRNINVLDMKIILSYTINLRAGCLSGCFMIPRQKEGGMNILSLCMYTVFCWNSQAIISIQKASPWVF